MGHEIDCEWAWRRAKEVGREAADLKGLEGRERRDYVWRRAAMEYYDLVQLPPLRCPVCGK